MQKQVRRKIAEYKNIDTPEKIFLGNGSDEAIDILVRAFCEPRTDSLMIMPPSYGMYRVCAEINDVNIHYVPLKKDFSLDVTQVIRKAREEKPKLIFICSPNNPSGKSFQAENIEAILRNTQSLVLLDEAYIDFSNKASWSQRINEFPNLVVLQTFSKAWGMAGVRMGMAFAGRRIIEIMNKIKYPYNVSDLTAAVILKALRNEKRKISMVLQIKKEREKLISALKEFRLVKEVLATDANFFLARFRRSQSGIQLPESRGIIVRDRSEQLHCEGCLRTYRGERRRENTILVKELSEYSEKVNK
ncbi:MAG: histidinol-phosphate transaminase [Candidatus Marinimicrobia bacterium]|nr:histidinol-phosphate transaminase [Candidatus Neomarinimicrobiota bacterium]